MIKMFNQNKNWKILKSKNTPKIYIGGINDHFLNQRSNTVFYIFLKKNHNTSVKCDSKVFISSARFQNAYLVETVTASE